MALLSKVLLCDLEFDGGVRLEQIRKQRRRWFSNLEVNWTIPSSSSAWPH